MRWHVAHCMICISSCLSAMNLYDVRYMIYEGSIIVVGEFLYIISFPNVYNFQTFRLFQLFLTLPTSQTCVDFKVLSIFRIHHHKVQKRDTAIVYYGMHCTYYIGILQSYTWEPK